MNCIARRGSQHLLADGEMGVIWDTKADTRSKQLRVQSILARGYWEDCTEHGPPELKHGNKGEPGYHLLHPGRAFRPKRNDVVVFRGQRYWLDQDATDWPAERQYVSLRHIETNEREDSALLSDIGPDTPEVIAEQRKDPHVMATEQLRQIVGAGAKVDVWLVDASFLDELVDTIRAEYERHPVLRTEIRGIRVEWFGSRGDSRLASWDGFAHTMTINSSWFGRGKRAKADDIMYVGTQTGAHPRSMTGIRGVVTHEIGHVLHGKLRQSGFDQELADGLLQHGVTVEGVGSYLGPRFAEGFEKVQKGVSKYGASNWAEMIAEAYADHRADGPDQSGLITLIGSMLDEAVKAERSEVRYNGGMGVAAIEGQT